MITLRNGSMEIIDNEQIKKIKGTAIDGTYIEIRYKNNWVDILASSSLGMSMRSIYRDKVECELSIKDMMDKFEVVFE